MAGLTNHKFGELRQTNTFKNEEYLPRAPSSDPDSLGGTVRCMARATAIPCIVASWSKTKWMISLLEAFANWESSNWDWIKRTARPNTPGSVSEMKSQSCLEANQGKLLGHDLARIKHGSGISFNTAGKYLKTTYLAVELMKVG